jgi:C4-dicarboxylate-specific signal transduction histidine kinase
MPSHKKLLSEKADITEKASIQRQLADTERLATLGKLTSKVAHELNNPMDGILRYINLTMRIVEQENLEKAKKYLTQCRKGLMRMVQIVSELLEFSRSTYAPFEHVKIEQIIEDAIKTMDTRAETLNVQILSSYAAGIPEIRSGNLFQVFCNLIKNALDALQQIIPPLWSFATREPVSPLKTPKSYSSRSLLQKIKAKGQDWDWQYVKT